MTSAMDDAYGNSCENISCTYIELAILFGSVDMICYGKGRRIIESKGPPAKKKLFIIARRSSVYGARVK